MEIILEFDIDFLDRNGLIIHYRGYNPTHDEFLAAGGPYSKYFKSKIGTGEKLVATSYYSNPDNFELDERVKTTMRDNKLTVCEAFFPCKLASKMPFEAFNYVVNYSFDNYKTFGFITMSSYKLL
jgi:hypothetical protein